MVSDPKFASSERDGGLKSGPAPELIQSAYRLEVSYGPLLYHGLSLADVAHIITLTEAGIIPPEAAQKLLKLLLDAHQIPADDFLFDPALGDAYKNRENYLTRLAPDVGGWLRTGRARREATNIAYQITVRDRILLLVEALAELAEALVNVADQHRHTIMPDLTYLQHAQPTTLAHYLLAFAYPILRDFARLQACYQRVNLSPGGIGSVNGSRLPFSRQRLAKLLGFDAAITHTRDAMWQADLPIEIMAATVASIVNLDRLSEDLQIWVTQEFDLVELADGFCRASVIMPQKKNPYSLAYVRGVAGVLIGQLTAMATVGKTISGQPDSRIFAYGDVPRSLDRAIETVRLLTGVIATLSVNVELMARRVAEGYSQATDLAELIMLEANLPYLTAHQLVGEVVSIAAQQGFPALQISSALIDTVAQRLLGRELKLADDVLAQALQPAEIVATRVGLGGAADGPVQNMLAELRQSVAEARSWQATRQHHLADAEADLIKTAHQLVKAV